MPERTMTPEEYASLVAVSVFAVEHGFDVQMPVLGQLILNLKGGLLMLINYLSNALIWLGGVLNVLGLLGGAAFLVLWLLGFVRMDKEETRCYKCEGFDTCPGYPGVAYPCAHYKKITK